MSSLSIRRRTTRPETTAAAISGLAVRRRIDRLDMIDVLKTRD